MLKYINTEIVFAEVPDEITLAINLSNCQIHCPECHSKFLWKNSGKELSQRHLEKLISENEGVTYQWCNKEGSRCLIYDVITDILSFSFQEKPISLEHDISKISDPKGINDDLIRSFRLYLNRFQNEKGQNIKRPRCWYHLRNNPNRKHWMHTVCLAGYAGGVQLTI